MAQHRPRAQASTEETAKESANAPRKAMIDRTITDFYFNECEEDNEREMCVDSDGTRERGGEEQEWGQAVGRTKEQGKW